MTSSKSYGALTLDVPSDFVDETLVVLRAPTPPAAVRMRVTAREPLRPSFVVKRVHLTADEAPALDDIGAAEEKLLAHTTQGFTLHGREVRELDGGRTTLLTSVSFDTPEGRLRQAHATTIIGKTALVFIATALDDASFNGVRDQLLKMVASARIT